jgi:hypothetical protein
MSEISRSVQIVKQGKKFADCTIRTVADVARSYTDVAGAELADSWRLAVKSFLDMWHSFDKWDGAMWPRHGLPRGSIFHWLFKIIWSLWGSNLGPLAMVERFHTAWVTNSPHVGSYYIYSFIYIYI